jgi:hypothetical protein
MFSMTQLSFLSCLVLLAGLVSADKVASADGASHGLRRLGKGKGKGKGAVVSKSGGGKKGGKKGGSYYKGGKSGGKSGGKKGGKQGATYYKGGYGTSQTQHSRTVQSVATATATQSLLSFGSFFLTRAHKQTLPNLPPQTTITSTITSTMVTLMTSLPTALAFSTALGRTPSVKTHPSSKLMLTRTELIRPVTSPWWTPLPWM